MTKTNEQLDQECIDLLDKGEGMRRELRQLETELSKACDAFGKRRGMSLFREWHVRNTIEIEKGKAA